MHGHPIPRALLHCRLCRQNLRPRQFHSFSINSKDQPGPSSPRILVRRFPVGQSDAQSPTPPPGRQVQRSNPSGNKKPGDSGPRQEIYRRASPQQRGAYRRNDNNPSVGGAPKGRVSGINSFKGNSSPRRRNRKQDDADDEDERLGPIETTHYEYLSEEHGDHFTSIEEVQNYAQVLDFLESNKELEERTRKMDQFKKSPKAFGAPSPEKLQEMEKEIEEERRRIDALIPEALQHIYDTDEKFLPRHEPPDNSLVVPERGQIGGVPIGSSGMSQLIEDGLRYLSKREGHQHQDAKILAQKLASGEFVKFVDVNERNEVMRLAESIEWEQGQDYNKENVGFEEPSDEAKKTLVETLVKGRYEDPKDKELKGKLIKSVARLAWGNATYPAASKDMLLSTIRELLPQERAASAGRQAEKKPT